MWDKWMSFWALYSSFIGQNHPINFPYVVKCLHTLYEFKAVAVNSTLLLTACSNVAKFADLNGSNIIQKLGSMMKATEDIGFCYIQLTSNVRNLRTINLRTNDIHPEGYAVINGPSTRSFLRYINFKDKYKIHEFISGQIYIELNAGIKLERGAPLVQNGKLIGLFDKHVNNDTSKAGFILVYNKTVQN